MIKINLLPIRAARKREYVIQQLILFAVLMVGGVLAIYLVSSNMDGKIETQKNAITRTEKQIEQYRKAIGEVEKFKGLEDRLNRKLEIIEDLIKGKTGPVRVLDKLSHLIPKQVWLLSWSDKQGIVELAGEALTNKYVAEFVSALKESGEPPATKLQGIVPDAPKSANGKKAKKKEQRKSTKKMFSDIKLVETVTVESKEHARSFVQFKISMRVNYSI
ncbi:MAG: PilN domain-containing protein [Deltaproteobacteria bacterium]|nr:PilN domain-containing protein [Deltaproteobacteria bacterium]